jgi:hypothetical protein
VVLGDVAAVLVAQQVFGEDFQTVGKFLSARNRVQPIYLVTAVADLQGAAGLERIHRIFAGHINSRI